MNQESKQPQHFLCTRIQLAKELFSNGKPCEVTINPWTPALKAWVFPVDDEVKQIVTEFYQSRGLTLPKMFRE